MGTLRMSIVALGAVGALFGVVGYFVASFNLQQAYTELNALRPSSGISNTALGALLGGLAGAAVGAVADQRAAQLKQIIQTWEMIRTTSVALIVVGLAVTLATLMRLGAKEVASVQSTQGPTSPFCQVCGVQVASSDSFCSKCGAKLHTR